MKTKQQILQLQNKQITPNHVFFETSQPLTNEQMEKLDFFINELLFDGDDEDHIPEFTTEFDQVDINQSH